MIKPISYLNREFNNYYERIERVRLRENIRMVTEGRLTQTQWAEKEGVRVQKGERGGLEGGEGFFL